MPHIARNQKPKNMSKMKIFSIWIDFIEIIINVDKQLGTFTILIGFGNISRNLIKLILKSDIFYKFGWILSLSSDFKKGATFQNEYKTLLQKQATLIN